ncbi:MULTISPECIES: hypothetical protein [Anaerolinea]|uniref:Uncharacterized protein n=1 Tax=Anaerolinea thermophila (strain DSM 14523 / JCM 11388 / NBRC 100420 / UNI-1) TaxID=926569 RepID=E8MZL3_ANATU|nr:MULTISPECIES: hypothetical protein [Anaerolinea]BAJ64561.1 hypothetical protein ANT_25350 [Anaerolinea thermophila UNI-1]
MSFFETLFERYELPPFILAFVFVAAGLGTAYLLGQVHTLTCERTAERQNCRIDVSWMGILPLRHQTLPRLEGAWVDESCDEDGCTYRVVLQTVSADFPLGVGYSSGKASKEEIVQKIQAFVKNPAQPVLEVKTGGGLWILFPLVFLLTGFWLGISPFLSTLFPVQNKP